MWVGGERAEQMKKTATPAIYRSAIGARDKLRAQVRTDRKPGVVDKESAVIIGTHLALECLLLPPCVSHYQTDKNSGQSTTYRPLVHG